MSRRTAPGPAPLVLAPELAARCTRTTRGAPGGAVSLVLGVMDREGLALADGLGGGAGADRARTAIVLRRERETRSSSPLTVRSISAATAATTSRSAPLSGIVFDAATTAIVPIAPATTSLPRQRRGRLGCFISCFLAVYAAGRSAPVPISRNPLASLERCWQPIVSPNFKRQDGWPHAAGSIVGLTGLTGRDERPLGHPWDRPRSRFSPPVAGIAFCTRTELAGAAGASRPCPFSLEGD